MNVPLQTPERRRLKIAIAHVTASFLTGGSEVYSWALARDLLLKRHDVCLLAGRVEKPMRLYPEVPVHLERFRARERWPKIGSRFQRLMERSSFLWSSRRFLKSGSFDVLNVHKPYDLPMAGWIKRRTGCKLIWRSHGPDYFPGLRRALRCVDAIYCVSECCLAELTGKFDVQARVIYTGVDTNFFSPDLNVRKPGPPRILYFGRLEGWKGVDYLVRALAQVSAPFQAVIAGAGPEQDKLREQIGTLKLSERVVLRAPVRGREEVRDLIAEADIAAFPVIGFETMSNAMLEAMAMGKTVVATKTGCFNEVLLDRGDALLVPARDVASLAKGIDSALASPDLRGRLGENARRKVMEKFDSRESFRQVESLFLQTAAAREAMT